MIRFASIKRNPLRGTPLDRGIFGEAKRRAPVRVSAKVQGFVFSGTLKELDTMGDFQAFRQEPLGFFFQGRKGFFFSGTPFFRMPTFRINCAVKHIPPWGATSLPGVPMECDVPPRSATSPGLSGARRPSCGVRSSTQEYRSAYP